MNIFDPHISGSLSVSGSGEISGDLRVKGIVSASISGDGSNLYNIPASGVTGLNLTRIANGDATASISSSGFTVNKNTQIQGNLAVTGSIIATEYIVSSSVVYMTTSFSSGSTAFGDDVIDTHTFSGSVNIRGSISLNGSAIGTGKLDETTFNTYTSSNNSDISAIETSTSSLNSFTSSIDTTIKSKLDTEGVISGSVQVNITGTTGYSTFSSSVDSLSSSIATTTNNLGGRISSLETASGSIRSDFNTYTSSNDSTNTTQNNKIDLIETSTGSLNSFTSSINTTIKNKLNTENVISGSVQVNIADTTGYSTFSSSILTNVSSSVSDLSSSVATTTSGITSNITSLSSSLTSSLGALSSSISSSINSLSSSIATTTLNLDDRIDLIETSTGSLNSYTSSNTTNISAIHTSTSSLNTFTSSASGRLDSIEGVSGSISLLNTYTGSNNTKLSSIESTTASLNSYTSSNSSRISTIESTTASLNTYTSSNNSRLSIIESTTSSLNSYTSSNNSRLSTIESTTASLNSYTSSNTTNIDAINTATNSLNSYTSSNTTNISAIHSSTSSLNTFTSSANGRLNSIESKTGSYATTGSNVFQGNQTITGSLYISQDLFVAGSSSIQHISSSVVNIADNIITVNAQNPTIRFGGLAVVDSGSSPQRSGSMLFDSVKDELIFVHQAQGTITSSVLLMGPMTFNDLGNETYIPANKLVKSTGIEHLTDSNISDTGTKVSINSNTEITGSLIVTSTISSTNITAIETATSSLNSFTSSINTTIKNKMNSDGVLSGSAQVVSSLPSGTVSGSSQVLSGTGIFSGSAQLPSGIVSGSSQITLSSTTGFGTYLNQALLTTSTPTFSTVSATTFTGALSGNATTATTAGALTSMNISQFTNNSGYLTSYSETSTLANVTARGNSTTTSIIAARLVQNAHTTALSNSSYATESAVYANAAEGPATAYPGFGFHKSNALGLFLYATTSSTLRIRGDAGTDVLVYHSGNLTNLNQLTNGPGYITSYTETDTLATVTARGATTSTATTFTGTLYARKSQTAGNYTTAALWTESHDNTATGIAFHISGVKGTFLEMRTNQILYWDGYTVYHSGNLTNLNQLTNGPGYITSITSGNVTTALGFTPYNATNPNGYISGISFANVSSKPTTISGYGITDAITTGNISSQSVSNASTVGGISPIQFFNNMGDSHGTRTSFDASTPSYNFGFRFIQGNTNGPALGGGGQFYSWYLGLGNDYPATGAGSYGMHVAVARGATTPYMSVRYNENNSLGSWIKIAAGYADTAGALSSMNISQFTNNSGYATLSGSNSFTNSYNEFGDGTGSVSNDGNWNGRLNLAGSSHARLDVTSVSDGIITTMYSHTGQGVGRVGTMSNHPLSLMVNGSGRVSIDTSGHLLPNSNNAHNLGSPSLGWANVYTNDLHLSNMSKTEGNDIDGTNGTWTIQEGSKNLYIINNNDGKKYKILLEEII